MRSVSLDPVAVRCVGPDKFGAPDKLLLTFQQSNKVLDEVQRGLEDYLQLKREVFPRFYFLSNAGFWKFWHRRVNHVPYNRIFENASIASPV